MEIVETCRNGDQEVIAARKKRSGGMHMVQVLLYMLRRRRNKPLKTGIWRRIVKNVSKTDSDITAKKLTTNMMIMPPPASETEEKAADNNNNNNNNGGGDTNITEEKSGTVEVFAATSSYASSAISGYGSAMSLRDMDCQDYDDDDYDSDDGCYGDYGGDNMIDEKAEEFIAKFYAQIKVQNQTYMERCKPKPKRV